MDHRCDISDNTDHSSQAMPTHAGLVGL